MYIKLHVLTGRLVDCEDPIIVSVIGNSEIALDGLKCQKFGDALFIKPYLEISFCKGFTGDRNGSTITF